MSSNTPLVIIGLLFIIVFFGIGMGLITPTDLGIIVTPQNTTMNEFTEVKESQLSSMIEQVEVIQQKLGIDMVMFFFLVLVLGSGAIFGLRFITGVGNLEDRLDSLDATDDSDHDPKSFNLATMSYEDKKEPKIKGKWDFGGSIWQNRRGKVHKFIDQKNIDKSKYIESPIANEDVFQEESVTHSCPECGLIVMSNWRSCSYCGVKLR